MHQILLVDDDSELCQLMADFLNLEGFGVVVANNGEEALTKLAYGNFDVIVLDVMMPGLNGFDTLRQLRRDYPTPVLMMTARGEEVDRIVGFELGADDYLPKPCSPRELVARLKAIIRRVKLEKSEPKGSSEVLTFGDIELKSASLSATLNGVPVELTQTEFGLLTMLMQHPGELVSKEAMMKQVLNRQLSPFDRTIDMHISNLRKKLGPQSNGASRIITIRGRGYMLAEKADA